MQVILSTRNPSKTQQVRTLFVGSFVDIVTLTEAGVEGEALEDGETLEQNALKKALFAHDNSNEKIWAMADDTGLFIDALRGDPGVRAARWAGEDAETEEITRYTLERLKGIKDRSATFKTVVAVVSPNREHHFFDGIVRGYLLEEPRAKPQPKMPYSPIFVPEGEDRVWAEMDVEYENNISHRGKAFRKVRKFLEQTLTT